MRNIKKQLDNDDEEHIEEKNKRFDNKNARMLQMASTISSFPIVIIILFFFHINIIFIILAIVAYIWTIILEFIQIKKIFKE